METKTIAKLQHFYEVLETKREQLAEEAITKDSEVYKHLSNSYLELIEEFVCLFGDLIYKA